MASLDQQLRFVPSLWNGIQRRQLVAVVRILRTNVPSSDTIEGSYELPARPCRDATDRRALQLLQFIPQLSLVSAEAVSLAASFNFAERLHTPTSVFETASRASPLVQIQLASCSLRLISSSCACRFSIVWIMSARACWSALSSRALMSATSVSTLA